MEHADYAAKLSAATFLCNTTIIRYFLRSKASEITFRKKLKKNKTSSSSLFFSCIQKEKLLSLKVKQPLPGKKTRFGNWIQKGNRFTSLR